jgi:hypothetical protein
MRLAVVLTILLAILLALPIEAADLDQSTAAQVTVTSVTLDPEVFMEGDFGTITVEVTNTGTGSVAIRRVTLYDNEIQTLSQSYDTTMYIGGGNKMSFTFTVKADVPEGIYYPVLSVDFRDAGYLRYPVKMQVQNEPLEVALLDKPDTFSAGKKDMVEILVGNPRDNAVNGVTVYPKGDGIAATPTSYFIGMLAPDASRAVSFAVTPSRSTELELHVDYKNGINSHSEVIRIPMELGESKKQADPLLSNILVVYEAGIYSITGDVNNAGLEDANAVVITSGSGVTPTDPYQSYVVGSLKPDDFASFEITFTASNVTRVPVVTSFKDKDGNLFTRETVIEIPAASPSSAGQDTGSTLMVGILVVVLAAVIGGVVLYSWRKR